MKKSNWIILAVLAIGAGFFLWLWYYLGFNFVDDPLDLVLAIVWWAVVAAAALGIHIAEKKRCERIRTVYVSQDALFNSEKGLLSFEDFEEGITLVDALEQTLSDLKYNFERADLPKRDEVRFYLIVHSEKFDKNDESKWEGEVVDVKTKETFPFKGKQELSSLLAE